MLASFRLFTLVSYCHIVTLRFVLVIVFDIDRADLLWLIMLTVASLKPEFASSTRELPSVPYN